MNSTAEGEPVPGGEAAAPPQAAGEPAATAESGAEAVRPRTRGERLSRRLRVLTGVDEDILDCIPSERTRYSALASIMIGTAAFSGVSMFFALAEVLGTASAWYLPLAVGWAAFILCLDRWLISSSSGLRWTSRAGALIPRFVVAVFIGLLIAEPLVLRLFQPAIEQKVRGDRTAAIRALRTDLEVCNPVPGVDPAPGSRTDCSTTGLAIDVNPGSDAAAVGQLLKQQSTLTTTINQETAQLVALETTVNAECNGVSGPGLTGKVGNGSACQQDERDVEDFRASHPIDKENAELAALTSQITTGQTKERDDQAAFAAARASKIDAEVAALPQPADRIGLGERFEALLALSRTSGIIGVTSILLRLFFILIDCLPVLLKFFTGATAYDRLADQEVASAERIFERAVTANETAAGLRIETELHNIRAQETSRRAETTIVHRNQAIETERNQLLEVDKLWAAKRARRNSAKAADDGGGPGQEGVADDAGASGQPPLSPTRLNGQTRMPRPTTTN